MTDQPHILVVDDHREIRESVTRYLEKNGLRATSARDAVDMDAKLAKGQFDLIVLDVMMPGEDGLSVCRRLSAKGGVPILMLTAMSQKKYIDAAFAAGATDYVTKPFDFLELFSRISVADKLASEQARVTEGVSEMSALKKEPCSRTS